MKLAVIGEIIILDKNTVPENFSLKLALVDALPVLFFGLAAITLGIKIESLIFTVGALICTISGMLKVLWKIIVAVKKKNIWSLFIQMRILMPIGFLILIVGLITGLSHMVEIGLLVRLLSFPALGCFIVWLISMVIMSVLAVKLDSSDVKSNWIEQLVNGVGQAFMFIGVIFL